MLFNSLSPPPPTTSGFNLSPCAACLSEVRARVFLTNNSGSFARAVYSRRGRVAFKFRLPFYFGRAKRRHSLRARGCSSALSLDVRRIRRAQWPPPFACNALCSRAARSLARSRLRRKSSANFSSGVLRGRRRAARALEHCCSLFTWRLVGSRVTKNMSRNGGVGRRAFDEQKRCSRAHTLSLSQLSMRNTTLVAAKKSKQSAKNWRFLLCFIAAAARTRGAAVAHAAFRPHFFFRSQSLCRRSAAFCNLNACFLLSSQRSVAACLASAAASATTTTTTAAATFFFVLSRRHKH